MVVKKQSTGELSNNGFGYTRNMASMDYWIHVEAPEARVARFPAMSLIEPNFSADKSQREASDRSSISSKLKEWMLAKYQSPHSIFT